jgi:release factor glutamine methyltransferase
VLIPRPETEELVYWIMETMKNRKDNWAILDIGTGSGCIPITIKKKRPLAQVTALDVSDGALEVAKSNAARHQVAINWQQLDILQVQDWEKGNQYEVIVSNPPYIPHSEKALMADNVLAYEPPLALFVENDNALIFYEIIAIFALQSLQTDGYLFFECNEFNAQQVVQLLEHKGYVQVVLQKDMSGRDRMIRARKK